MANEFTKAALYGIKTFNKKVKEKIGMQKLIELLNEYGMEKDNYSGVISEEDVYHYSVLYISKKFGFIKWLVENDKIDLWSNTFTEKEERYFGEQPDFTFQSVKYTHLLMLLSISDTPIEDLISYLK